jgi:CDP-glucose 4,6-dehydratase
MAMSSEAPEIVFHLAAQPLVKTGYDEPHLTFSTNISGTTNLLQACRLTPSVRVIVNVTTDKVYQMHQGKRAFIETDALGANDPYSTSKACSELITRSFQYSFLQNLGISSATARSGNVIGGGDWAQFRILPDIVRAIYSNKSLTIRHPGAVRPWQHVLDSVSGYVLLAQTLYEIRKPVFLNYNFSPLCADDRSVNDLITEIKKYYPTNFPVIVPQSSSFHEEEYLRLDSSLAEKDLKWKNRWNFETTIHETLNWYDRYYAGEDSWTLTQSQIENFKRS